MKRLFIAFLAFFDILFNSKNVVYLNKRNGAIYFVGASNEIAKLLATATDSLTDVYSQQVLIDDLKKEMNDGIV